LARIDYRGVLLGMLALLPSVPVQIEFSIGILGEHRGAPAHTANSLGAKLIDRRSGLLQQGPHRDPLSKLESACRIAIAAVLRRTGGLLNEVGSTAKTLTVQKSDVFPVPA
jgi:hypothetical protein